MKLVRHVALLRGERARRLVVGLKGSYHGLMYGSHGLTGEALGQHEYAVDQRLVRHVDPTRPTELAELCEREGDRISGLFLEPVLGTGALEVGQDFLREAFRLADEYGFAIVADEVATGFYRTGPLRASSAWHRQPDIVLLSKGLTNGTCASAAVVISHAIVGLFQAADDIFIHAETQAGHTRYLCGHRCRSFPRRRTPRGTAVRAARRAARRGARLDHGAVRPQDHGAAGDASAASTSKPEKDHWTRSARRGLSG